MELSLRRYDNVVLCHCSAKEKIACCEEDLVYVRSDGTCIWWRQFQLSITHCPIDITWFPVDKQHCNLVIGSKAYESKDMVISAATPAVECGLFQSNSEWHLTGKIVNTYYVETTSEYCVPHLSPLWNAALNSVGCITKLIDVNI